VGGWAEGWACASHRMDTNIYYCLPPAGGRIRSQGNYCLPPAWVLHSQNKVINIRARGEYRVCRVKDSIEPEALRARNEREDKGEVRV
jgi:hypothetical protein